jgi:hypothetical protein
MLQLSTLVKCVRYQLNKDSVFRTMMIELIRPVTIIGNRQDLDQKILKDTRVSSVSPHVPFKAQW